ncbi:Phenylalanyl-tRNA synthetase, beta subunit [Elusimicrobium minutum Pei191]|uniref:Phenylalanine--tRNA ligase beta subunit n=1 Tax=Elusimicrobium minutum (strain Pei191) TaxID=445932 RepID=B2KBL7_ELUMP|nr:phenylalanine--tRNA ligase subunit beta [Elusimicrobium minutum]ACC97704.1 Phenylalanyl-tRNA synthetase, beta subunit [Elusimicrobium minutum Pei191]
MKILYSWLKDYIDIDLSAEELAQKLNSVGIEVAEIQKTGVDFEGVHTAKIVTLERHPNADKLSLVTLDTGNGTRKVVCGAGNLEAGIIVPLAREGARLGKTVLKAAEIRGVKSDGMICSSDELGLTATRQKGILHLDKNLKPGIDVSTLYPKADYLFELEITSNRPDLLSHLGVARELSILLNIPLKEIPLKEVKEEGESIDVKIETENCARYTSRVVRGVQNAQSPEWMKQRLSAMGVNPKNALVDISNYVLYDIGLPLHFFDLSDIGESVIIRQAAEGEVFETLDGSKLNLTAQDILIADKNKGLCLAGIMGGIGSGIKETTKNIFIEAAYFNPPAINKSAKKYGFSSEASQRFERGADIGITPKALARATNLVQELCGGKASKSSDVYPVPYTPEEVSFTPEDIEKILGMKIDEERFKEIFSRLAQKFDASLKPWKFNSPTHRRDLNHKWDLAEEAARFYGLDKLPVSETRASVAFSDNPRNTDTSAKFASALISAGFYECKNFDFLCENDLQNFSYKKEFCVEIANPLNEDYQYMRPTLFAGLLKNANFNQSRGTTEYKIFETGKEYQIMKGFPAETWVMAGIVCGAVREQYFADKTPEADFYFVKGAVEAALKNIAGVNFSASKEAPAYMHPKICADIIVDGKQKAGFIGKIHPLTAKAYGLKNDDIYAFYLNIKVLEKKFNAQEFKPAEDAAQFPSSYRDLSFVIGKDVGYAKVLQAVNSSGVWSKMSVDLMDVYTGANLPEGKKSLTLNFAFWLMDRTLKDAEVEENMNKIFTALTALGAELRK